MGAASSVLDTEINASLLPTIEKENEDHVTDLPFEQCNKPTMAVRKHPPLKQRPSVIIKYAEDYELNQELELEKVVLANDPSLKKVLGGFEDVKKSLSKAKSIEQLGELHNILQEKLADVFSKHTADEHRTVMANKLARLSVVGLLVEWHDFVREEFNIESVLNNAFVDELASFDNNPPPEPFLKEGYQIILDIRVILWNYSDSSHRLSIQISETTFLKTLVNDLRATFKEEFSDMQDEEEVDNLFPFSSAVGILHNCARNQDISKEVFRSIQAVAVLAQFLQARSSYVKMVTLLALSNMVNEKEVSKLATDNDVVTFLTTAIGKAMKAEDHKEHGFHLAELVDGLASMAQSDDNKNKIMEKDILDLITKILLSKDITIQETLACVKLIWELSFSEGIKNEIKKKEKLMKKLRQLQESKKKDIKDAVNNVLFLLVDKDERMHTEDERPTVGAPPIRGSRQPDTVTDIGHIMISYSWGDKETVLKIYKDLTKAGIPVWIDVAEMDKYMNVLEGMARAVEGAFIILICYSEKYKNSQNCRTEADYLFVKKKTFIPLKMQRDYSPDGWLGALIGAKLYIEFSGKYPYEQKFSELLDRIQKEQTGQRRVIPHTIAELDPSPPKEQLTDWSKDKVSEWLSSKKMMGASFKRVKLLTGHHLAYLLTVMRESPDTYYRWLETKLELKTLDDLMTFDEAFRGLGF